MHAQASRPVPTSSRTRRTVRNVAIAAIATIPACSSDDSDAPTAAGTASTVPTTASAPTHTPTSIEATPVTLRSTTETGFFAGAEDVPLTFTVPAGWENAGWAVVKSNADPLFGVNFFDVANIYADGCQWVLVDPPVGPTVDDLVSAWANLPAFAATAPRDVTVDGFEGKQIEFTVPDYNEDECRENKFALWQEDGAQDSGDAPNLWAQGPNQHMQLWILDVDDTRLVIKASYFPNTSQQDRADLDSILDSIQIG